MAGVHVYSLLCEKMFGRRPSRVQLLYLSKPGEDRRPAPTDAVGARRRSEVERGDAGDPHRVQPRRLPAATLPRCARSARSASSAPSSVATLRRLHQCCWPGRPEREGRPQLPLVIVVSRHSDRRPSSPGSTPRSTARSTGFAHPALDRIVYRLSSAADHSLLWHACGTVRALRTTEISRAMARFAGAMGIESALTNGRGQARLPAGSVPVTTPRSSSVPVCARAGHVVIPVGPRDHGVLRGDTARRRARARTPSRLRSPRPGCTSVCTTGPTSWPAPRSASRSAPRFGRSSPAGNDGDDRGEPDDQILRRELRLPLPVRTQRAGVRRARRAGRQGLGRHVRAVLPRPGARRRGETPVWDRPAAERGTGVLALEWGHRGPRHVRRRSSSTSTSRSSQLVTTMARSSPTRTCCARRVTTVDVDADAIADEVASGRPLKDPRRRAHRRGEALGRCSAYRPSASATARCSCG